MELSFYCNNCDKIFTAEPRDKEYNDPVFGPCKTVISDCPDCKAECSEYRRPRPKVIKTDPDIPTCTNCGLS